MNVADEIAKLEALHQSGTLNDEEFAKAKAALLNQPQRPSANPLAGKLIGCSVWVVILAATAYFVVPWASRQWKDFSEKVNEASEAQEKAALLEGGGIQRLDAELDQGLLFHDLLLVNKGEETLTDATLTVTVIKPDNSKIELQRHWGKWVSGEKKKVTISASGTRPEFGVIADGFAYVEKDGNPKKVQLANTWEWGKK